MTTNHLDHSHGYTIGAEQCITTQHITMEYNFSYNAKYEDLSVGAYGGNGYLYGDEIALLEKVTVMALSKILQ